MLWQEIIVLSIVGITALTFLLSNLRNRKKLSFQRATHCGCSNTDNKGKGSIVIEGKRGETPRVSLRMK